MSRLKSMTWMILMIGISLALELNAQSTERNATLAQAQTEGDPQYRLEKFTMDAGGLRMTGDGYVLTGTLGQFDAAVMSMGDAYRLQSGFWQAQESEPLGDAIFEDGFEGQ